MLAWAHAVKGSGAARLEEANEVALVLPAELGDHAHVQEDHVLRRPQPRAALQAGHPPLPLRVVHPPQDVARVQVCTAGFRV